VLCAFALGLDRLDRRFDVGEPVGAEESLEEADLLLGCDDLAVDQHVELTTRTDVEINHDPKRFFDPGGDPRRAWSVASGATEEDFNVHGALGLVLMQRT
jgi:hypothetical protein